MMDCKGRERSSTAAVDCISQAHSNTLGMFHDLPDPVAGLMPLLSFAAAG